MPRPVRPVRPDLPVGVRAAVAAAPPYVPGRRPVDGRPVARLASNELWYGDASRYPEPTALDLRLAVSAHLGVAADAVVASPGSVALCRLLVETVCDPGDSVVFPWRSFEAYPMLAALAGAVPVPVPLTPAGDHDLPAMAAAVTDRTRLVFVCSPNNPTGTVLDPAAFNDFLAAVPGDVLVVLDEAYVEFTTAGPDGLALLGRHPNLLVLRTFSKAYGLAAARVGYGVCDPALAALLRSVQVPFAVAQPSIDLAVAALGTDLAPMVAAVTARRADLASSLANFGVVVPEAHGNFVWLPIGSAATALAAALAERDVLVRAFDGEGVRITVGGDADMAMLRPALVSVLAVSRPGDRAAAWSRPAASWR